MHYFTLRRTIWHLCAFVLLLPVLAFAQAPCTHYASQAGGGNGLSLTTPFRINQFWAVAQPGSTLCLLDGTYTGGASMIEPPPTLHGTPTQPITIRALNEGKVLLDGQGNWVVYLRSSWMVVEGINARHGSEFLYGIFGQHNRVRRSIGWHGTSGENDSNIWRVAGTDNIAEDCAGWGDNSRKIFDGAQAGDVGQSGFRRCWGEWNDHPQGASQPNTTYQVSYNTSNQLFENVLGTWNRTGQSANTEAVMSMSNNCDGAANDVTGTLIAGSIMYVPSGASYQPGNVIQGFCLKNLRLRDVVAFVAPGFSTVRPFDFYTGGGQAMSGNICENCLGIHAGSASTNASGAGFTTPGFREGNGVAAATGGVSAFTLLPGICKRYVGGQLTNDPLWPWPMDARIREARIHSGKAPVTVTDEIEAILGPIPAACRVGTIDPGHDVTVAVPPLPVIPGGVVVVTWSNIVTPSPTDWVGLYLPGDANNAYRAWRYTSGQASGTAPFTIPASIAPGTYEVRLLSNDGYTRLATSAPLTIAKACTCPCVP